MKFQRTALALVMMSVCTLVGPALAVEQRPAPHMDAAVAARTADISPFWIEGEMSEGARIFAAIGETLGR